MKSHSDGASFFRLRHVTVLGAFQTFREVHGAWNGFQNELDSTFRTARHGALHGRTEMVKLNPFYAIDGSDSRAHLPGDL